jgi:hypothetical protein
LRRDFLLVTLAFICFALLPEAPAVDPPPDGGDLAGNKAERTNTLFTLTIGSANTGLAEVALYSNTTGNDKTASGQAALSNNTTGSNKVGLSFSAGANPTDGRNNIDIGHTGVASETGRIRIGTAGRQTATFIAGIYNVSDSGTIKRACINSTGRLDTQPPASLCRLKTKIKPVHKSSEVLLVLKPVMFHYENNEQRTAQFGLIAKKIARLSSALVVLDDNGEIYRVRYDTVNAMLLNEFLKEHGRVEELEGTIARQQKQIEGLSAGLQKMSAQVEVGRQRRKLSLMSGNMRSVFRILLLAQSKAAAGILLTNPIYFESG